MPSKQVGITFWLDMTAPISLSSIEWPLSRLPKFPRMVNRLSVKGLVGGRHWTRTSDLLHVKHFRLNAVLGAWKAEQDASVIR